MHYNKHEVAWTNSCRCWRRRISEDFQKVLEENKNPIAFDETPSNADSGNELDYYLEYLLSTVIWK